LPAPPVSWSLPSKPESTFQHSVNHAESFGPGSTAVIAKLSVVLFVETFRLYITKLPPTHTGWLAGVRDPDVGKALALLHK
jgi:hypothetical protein